MQRRHYYSTSTANDFMASSELASLDHINLNIYIYIYIYIINYLLLGVFVNKWINNFPHCHKDVWRMNNKQLPKPFRVVVLHAHSNIVNY